MRSAFTNKLVKELFDNSSNILVINDGGARYACSTFKEACEAIDSVDDVSITVKRKHDNYTYGLIVMTMCNDDEEQLVDHSDGEWLTKTIDRLLKEVA